jgi:group II intron reverse transcriptase/maturase
MDHNWLLTMLKLRIDDRAFLGLIRKWLKAGVLETDGTVMHPDTGTPQGGVVSPVLANVYLHYVMDLWFEKVVKTRCDGQALISRYSDDLVCAFQFRQDAERFYRALPERLGKFALEVAPEKTRVLRFSRFHPTMKRRFTFLGFEFFWSKDRKGIVRVTRRTARAKLYSACRRIKEWIKKNRHLPGKELFRGLNIRLQGHYNYYGVYGNILSLYRFVWWVRICAFKWLNRRGGKKKSFTWEKFAAILDGALIRPRITEMKHRRVYA